MRSYYEGRKRNIDALPAVRWYAVEQLEVHVIQVLRDGALSHIRGFFILNGERLNFTGVAFTAHGGPNIHAELPPETQTRLAAMGYSDKEVEQLAINLQVKLVQGDIVKEYDDFSYG